MSCNFPRNSLLVGILSWPSKRNVLIERKITKKSDQSHVWIEHHPVDLLALLQPWKTSPHVVDREANRNCHVFIDTDDDEVNKSLWKVPPVPKEKSTETSKLWNWIISEHWGLVTFFAFDSNPNVSWLNHIYIICSVTNCKCHLSFCSRFDEVYYVCFLGWRCSVNNYCLCWQ